MNNQATVNIESKNVLARLMATENIHVEHKKVKTASFDVKNRVLRLPLWEKMDDTMYEGLIGHEVGHALYTPDEEWSTFAKENPSLKDYANILEDARIERKMKIKYPGMKRTFFNMYNDLNQRDFFGAKDRDLDGYGFADRLNMYFKLGLRAEVPFSDVEKDFAARVLKAETFEDILDLTRELGDITKAESETNMEDLPFDFDDLEPDSIEENDGESENSNTPAPSSDSKDESDEESDNSGSQDSDEEKKEEEKSAGSGPAKSDEKGEEENESTTPDSTDNGKGTEDNSHDPLLPKPETSKAFEDAMESLNDSEAKEPVYLDLPKVSYKNAVVSWKDTFEELNEHWADKENYGRYWNDGDDRCGEKKKEIENNFRVWKKDTNQIVNYMVKEFEMKQAATVHRRTSVGKTGMLDMNKLHMYKTDEDIFKRVASVKDGRNHALMMFVDWSGSMSGKMESTIKQLLTLVMFARKVGIPYRVYSFSNSSDLTQKLEKNYYDPALTPTNHLKMARLGMNEYFNEKMSSRDFNKQLMNLMFLGRSNDYTSLSTPKGHGMSSTPLNEAIVCAYDMIADFKKETGKEKINAIFLTDGGADGNTEWYDAEEKSDRSMYGFRNKEYMVIRDPITKRLLHGVERRSGLTASLLTGLAKRHNINVIGFHITDRKTINRSILFGTTDYEVQDKLKKFCTKNGYAPLKESGYSTYFLVNDRALDNEAELGDVERGDDGDVAKGKLRTQFRKFTSTRKTNKMMLNEFVSLVA